MDPLITACSCSKCLTFFLYCVKQLIAKLNEEDLPEAVSIFTEELLMQAELSVVGSSDDQTIAYTVATVASWLRLYHVIGQHFMNWIRGKIEGNHLYQDWFDRGWFKFFGCVHRNWFDFYASAEFKELVVQTEFLLDQSCQNLSEVQLQILDNRYRTSLKDAVSFFSHESVHASVRAVVPILPKPPKRSDVYLICQLASVISFKQNCSPSYDSGLLVELEPNYQNLVKSLTPIVSVVGFDNVKVGEVFDSLSQLREILYRNVEESQKLVGIDRRRMHKTSRENVSVNPDFISLINKLHNKEDFNGFVHVYSLDFSSDFVSNIFETGSLLCL